MNTTQGDVNTPPSDANTSISLVASSTLLGTTKHGISSVEARTAQEYLSEDFVIIASVILGWTMLALILAACYYCYYCWKPPKKPQAPPVVQPVVIPNQVKNPSPIESSPSISYSEISESESIEPGLPSYLKTIHKPEDFWTPTASLTGKRKLVDKRENVQGVPDSDIRHSRYGAFPIDRLSFKDEYYNLPVGQGRNKSRNNPIGQGDIAWIKDEFFYSYRGQYNISRNNPVRADTAWNRFPHIPFEEKTRVILEPDSSSDSTYINANHMFGYSDICDDQDAHGVPRINYIAAASPFNTETALDFWRMIHQKDIQTVVTVTNVLEDGVVKCAQFWPSYGQKIRSLGHFFIQTVEEDIFANCTIRKIKFRVCTCTCLNEVTQFQFTSWPKRGVPDSCIPFLEFRHKVREDCMSNMKDKDSTILVHCGTGITRTAIFIALDILIDQYEKEGGISVYDIVSRMRNHRPTVVRSVEQYTFIFQTVKENFEAGDTRVRLADGVFTYRAKMDAINPRTNRSWLEDQFDLLNFFALEAFSMDLMTMRELDGRNVAPYRKYPMDFLRPEINALQDYATIKPVFVDSVRQKNAIVLLFTPNSAESTYDFWRFVSEYNIITIINLGDSRESQAEITEGVTSTVDSRPSGSQESRKFSAGEGIDAAFKASTICLTEYDGIFVRTLRFEQAFGIGNQRKVEMKKIRHLSVPYENLACQRETKVNVDYSLFHAAGGMSEGAHRDFFKNHHPERENIEQIESAEDAESFMSSEDNFSVHLLPGEDSVSRKTGVKDMTRSGVNEDGNNNYGAKRDVQVARRSARCLNRFETGNRHFKTSYSDKCNDRNTGRTFPYIDGINYYKPNRFSDGTYTTYNHGKINSNNGQGETFHKVKLCTSETTNPQIGNQLPIKPEKTHGRQVHKETLPETRLGYRTPSSDTEQEADSFSYRSVSSRVAHPVKLYHCRHCKSAYDVKNTVRHEFPDNRNQGEKRSTEGPQYTSNLLTHQITKNTSQLSDSSLSSPSSSHTLVSSSVHSSSTQDTDCFDESARSDQIVYKTVLSRQEDPDYDQHISTILGHSRGAQDSKGGLTVEKDCSRVIKSYKCFGSTEIVWSLDADTNAGLRECREKSVVVGNDVNMALQAVDRNGNSSSSINVAKDIKPLKASSSDESRTSFNTDPSNTDFIKSKLEDKSTNSINPKPAGKSTSSMKPSPERKSTTSLMPSPERKSTTSMMPSPERKSITSIKYDPEGKSTTSMKPSAEGKSTTLIKHDPEGRSTATIKPNPEGKSPTSVQPTPESTNPTSIRPNPEGKSATSVRHNPEGKSTTSIKSSLRKGSKSSHHNKFGAKGTVSFLGSPVSSTLSSVSPSTSAVYHPDKSISKILEGREKKTTGINSREMVQDSRPIGNGIGPLRQTESGLQTGGDPRPSMPPGKILELIEVALDWQSKPLRDWHRMNPRRGTPPKTPPLLIHAPEGSGASSLLCACALLCEHAQEENAVDVYHLIKDLRQKCPRAIENFSQYEHIWDVLCNYVFEYQDHVQFSDRWRYRENRKKSIIHPAIDYFTGSPGARNRMRRFAGSSAGYTRQEADATFNACASTNYETNNKTDKRSASSSSHK